MFCVGSSGTYAYGIVDSEYQYDMSVEEARELGKRAIMLLTGMPTAEEWSTVSQDHYRVL